MAMLMEGGGGNIVMGNIPSSPVAAAVLKGCERIYDCGSPQSNEVEQTSNVTNTTVIASTTTPDNVAVIKSTTSLVQADSTEVDVKDKASINDDLNEATAGCSTTLVGSFFSNTNVSGSTTTDECTFTELRYPAIGSPPADLMVVNTNGFNPLQHAALRGNPG